VTLGTLAGYTIVIATAGAGQLTLRMTVPGRDDLGTTNTPNREGDDRRAAPSYGAAVRLAPPDGDPRVVALRGCGPGCFTGPITWREGSNPLLVDVSAPTWPAATTRLDIPWPPRPDAGRVPAMLATMRAVPTMTLHQSVTSNYTGDPGPEKTLTLSGPDYLSAEPYANGGGNPITVPTGSEVTDLRLGFPQGIAVRLLLAPDGRILREEETTPNHLVTTTIEYPTTGDNRPATSAPGDWPTPLGEPAPTPATISVPKQ
jgi:copper transport protein